MQIHVPTGKRSKGTAHVSGSFLCSIFLILLLVAPLAASPDDEKAHRAVNTFRNTLNETDDPWTRITEAPFASVPLTKKAVRVARRTLLQAHARRIQRQYEDLLKTRRITVDGTQMKFDYNIHGTLSENGRRLYLSLHGGGGTSAAVNDRQWENQKTLYEPGEGIYLAPRAPTNDWNLWHKSHIDDLFSELIEALLVLKNVNPNRVYLLGYSAGGDGVYQLAPRMADRWAAAAAMAGHPNDANPKGLRNVPFAIDVGARDDAYDRNEVAREWKSRLDQLRKADPEGYTHRVHVHKGVGHWMEGKEVESVRWLGKIIRNPHPKRVVWYQDNVLHERLYWLAVDRKDVDPGDLVIARYDNRTIQIEHCDLSSLRIRLNDRMMNLDKPVRVVHDGKTVFRGRVQRTIQTLADTLEERGDPATVYSSELRVNLDK